jgi:hypothetical protein
MSSGKTRAFRAVVTEWPIEKRKAPPLLLQRARPTRLSRLAS